MTLSTQAVHAGLVLNAEQSEVNQFSSADSEYGNVSVIPQRPEPAPAGRRERVVRFAFVALEGVGGSQPLRRERVSLGEMPLSVRDHRSKSSPGFAVPPSSESSHLTRRPRCGR